MKQIQNPYKKLCQLVLAKAASDGDWYFCKTKRFSLFCLGAEMDETLAARKILEQAIAKKTITRNKCEILFSKEMSYESKRTSGVRTVQG